MDQVEIRLITNNKDAVKGMREVGAEAQKLSKSEEQYTQKRKGLIEKEIQMQKQLSESRTKASNIENLRIYNKLLEASKERLDKLNQAGIEGNKQVEKASDGVIGKIGRMAVAYLTVETAIKVLKETALAFFTRSQQGIELLERKISGLKAAVGVLQGEFIKLGKSMIGEKGDEATPWGTRIVNGLRMIATTANVIPGVRKYFDDLAASMNDASKAAENFTRIQQDLEDAERAMIVPRAQANAEIIKARLIYADITKSSEERIAALEKALELEQKTAEEEVKHQQWVILNLRDRNVELEKRGQLMDEDRKELEEAIAHEIELQSESSQRQIRAFRSLMEAKKELNDKANDEIKKAQDAFNKYWDQVDKEEFERLKKAAEDKWKFEVEYGQKLFDQKKKQAEKDYELIEEKNKAQKKAEEELSEMRKESLLSMSESVTDYISIIDDLIQKEVERTQRQRELLDTQISETQSALDTEVSLHKAGYASNIEAKQKELEELKRQRDAALAEEEKARKKQHQIEVASLLAQKAVDVAKIISSTAVANAKAVALSPLTFGQPWVSINNAAAALGVAAAAAAVIAASTAKYDKGGWTGEGKYKDSTGERMAGIVHEREFVVRRGPAHKFRGVLEAINKDDRMMAMKSLDKIMPQSNNIVIDNNGSNSRLDKLISENQKLNLRLSHEEIIVLNGMTVYKKGNSTRIIKK